MPRPVRPWFRFYTETFRDRKIRRLKPAQRWVWAAILGAARESPEAGRLLVAVGHPMSVAELADYAGVTEREAKATLVEAQSLAMVHLEDDVWVVTNFGARQFESDNTTERTRKHRAKEPDRVVPIRDVGTFPSRSREREGNTPESETETDTSSQSPGNPPPRTSTEDGLTGDQLRKVQQRLRCDLPHAVRVAAMVLSKSKGTVNDPLRYVLKAIDDEPGRYAPTPSAGQADEHCPVHPGKPMPPHCGGCIADARAAS